MRTSPNLFQKTRMTVRAREILATGTLLQSPQRSPTIRQSLAMCGVSSQSLALITGI
ncbi:hypothetical protein OAG76_00835 [Rubripirellula sp.]|nr:hypothetical protein [Rubripirellula sp.]